MRGENDGLGKLLAWLSPSFPVGAFSYSHGLEWAIEAGDISDRATLETWLADLLAHGAGLSDAAFLVHAHRAVSREENDALSEVAELAAAFQPSRERALESHSQGAAFLMTVEAAWPAPGLARLRAVWDGPVAYPIAVGTAAAAHGLGEAVSVEGYLHAFAANLISAAVRLIPLGQTDGQRVLAGLQDRLCDLASRASELSLDEVGGAALRSDIASMRHETQYTRLFRS